MATKTAKLGRALGERFVQTARRNWRRRCISDSAGKCLNYGQTLVNAIALADEIKKITYSLQTIGILLPPSIGGALANLAVTLLGKVAVNLNYSVSQQLMNSAIKQCGIKTIISSRQFTKKLGHIESLEGLVFLEDIAGRVTLTTKIRAYLKARFMPQALLANARLRCGDDLATVVFSSGSTGQPKGVMLSHDNIISNIEAVCKVFKLKPDDNLCGVLGFFHSFGFTCSLWLPVISGVSASYVANPLDGKLVGQTAHRNRCTILFAAPTFLLNYIRRAEHEDFVSLRAVVVGAEKMKKHLADSFEAEFGIRPLEGYGTTELSPVVALNVPEALSWESYQSGSREGTVGRPIPGVQVKIVQPDSKKEVPPGQEGLLVVKGPNVMLGYLNGEKETAEVLQDGWYNTGDIASIDEDGFLTITDRLSRFSKIGGEMVPHLGVEEIYLRGLNTNEQLVAVTGIPEHKKGEELVVLYVDKAGDADKLHEIVDKSSLPNMWRPRRGNYIKIRSIPMLASGKLDVIQLKKMALAAKNGQARVGSECQITNIE